MNDERVFILELLRDGKIDVQETIRLLDTLDRNESVKSISDNDTSISNKMIKKAGTFIGSTIGNIENFIRSLEKEDFLLNENRTYDNSELNYEEGNIHNISKEESYNDDSERDISYGSNNDYSRYYKKEYSDSFILENNNLEIVNPYGDIILEESQDEEIHIDANILVDKKFYNAEYDYLSFITDESASKLSISNGLEDSNSEEEDDDLSIIKASITVLIPKDSNCNLLIKSSNGFSSINNLILPSVTFDMYKSDISINNSSIDELKSKALKGDIDIKSCQFKDLNINSLNATLSIDKLYADRSHIQNTNGYIIISSIENTCSLIDLSSTNGKVNLSDLPDNKINLEYLGDISNINLPDSYTLENTIFKKHVFSNNLNVENESKINIKSLNSKILIEDVK